MVGFVGCVSNSNDTLMETLADNGDGSYAYVDDGSMAQPLTWTRPKNSSSKT
ncbi:MAG: hypothetical protein JXB38_04550 [Anaerolineales bacterium]|nr:hypothetical protein [Anaerolineales bacterium]